MVQVSLSAWGTSVGKTEKSLRERLSESETRLGLALRATGLGVWEWTIATNAIFWSPECFAILGVTEYMGTLDDFTSRVVPEDRARVMTAAEVAIATRTEFVVQFRIARPDGELRWVENVGRAFFDEQGNPVRMLGTVRDVSAQREAEALKREQADRLTLALAATRTGVWERDLLTGATTWSPECYDIVGIDSFDGTSDSFLRTIHEEDLPGVLAAFDRALLERTFLEITFRIRRPNGEIRRLANLAQTHYGEDGRPLRMVGTVREIVEPLRVAGANADQDQTRHIIEGLPVMAWAALPDGSPAFTNQRLLDYHGLTAEAMREGWPTTIHPDDVVEAQARRRAALAAGEGFRMEIRLRRHDGEWRWFQMDVSPARAADGRIRTWIGTFVDVHERHLLHERALREEERLHGILEAVADGVVVSDLDGRQLHWNQTAIAMHGFATTEEWERKRGDLRTIFECRTLDGTLVPVDQWPSSRLRRQEPVTNERCRVRRLDMSWERVFRYDGAIVPREGEAPLAVLTIADITALLDAEVALQESERYFRELTESLPQLVWACDADGMNIFVGPQWESYTGVPASQHHGTGWLSTVHPDDVPALMHSWNAAIRDGTPYHRLFRIRRHDGMYRWFDVQARPFRDETGRIVRWVGANSDIQGERELRERLRQEQERLARIMEVSPAIIYSFRIGPDGLWTLPFASPAITSIFGRTSEELAQDPALITQVILPEDLVTLNETIAASAQSLTPWCGEFRIQHPTHGIIWVEGRSSPVRDADGGTTWHGVLIDITERKRTEAERRQWADAFEHTSHAIALGDPATSRIMACNPAYARLLGRSVEEIRTIPILDLYEPEDHPIVLKAMEASHVLGQSRFEARIVRADGVRVPVEGGLASVRGEDGHVAYRVAALKDISERKRAIEELRATRDELQALDRASPVPIVALDPAGIVLHWNRAAEHLFGWQAREVIGHPLRNVPPDKEPEFAQFRARVLSGSPLVEESIRVSRSGRRIPVRISSAPLHDKEGNRIGLVAVIVDLTEQNQLAAALRASEEQFSVAFQASPMASALLRASDRSIIEVNQAYLTLCGHTREEVVGRNAAELCLTAFADRGAGLASAMEVSGQTATLPMTLLRHDGSSRDTIASVRSVEIRGETHYLILLQDVTERNRAESALRESEERLRLFIEHAPASLAMFDREMRYLAVSQRWLRDFKIGEQELLGRSHYEVFPEISAEWKAIHRRALAGEVLQAEADCFVRSDGTAQWLRWEVRPWYDAAGAVGGILVFSEDITSSLKAEAAIRESDARFRELAESISEVFWLSSDDQHRMLYISPGYEAVWGRSCQSLYDDPGSWVAAIHPEDRKAVLANARNRPRGTAFEEEYRILRPDGTSRWIRVKAFPVHQAEGAETRFAGVAEDITERRQLEMQLRQTQKLESVGLLAGGVAHDFNNWLTVISGCTELLLQDITGNGEATELLGEVRHATDRASSLTRQLLAFSRQEVIEPRVMDLTAVVIDTEKMLRRILGEDILLTTALGTTSSRVRIDPGQWGQVLMNLAVNARDAMPRGGRLAIETSEAELDDSFVRTHPGVRPGRYALLTMTDTGSGMTPEVRQRIFEPFFTTKGVGHGTGLGLAVVHGIVTQSGGMIDVQSELGVGTTFRVYLPALEEVAMTPVPDSAMESLGGTETILLVEDDDSLRKIALRTLKRLGYTILQAEHGEEALAIVANHTGPIHLLLTDVVMPRMDGRELAERLAPALPELRVLYTSGYTDDAVVRHGVLQAQVAFIAKPYTPAALRRKVREVLDRKPGGA